MLLKTLGASMLRDMEGWRRARKAVMRPGRVYGNMNYIDKNF